ncbi:hypothetical protein [Cryobacterium sp. BB736]|uniref:hypothetical protein n=1 Tax=Cryobacterium sp. BB736 TaxID=2746963 RepID=UPI0018740E5A|nr:hypothetical protein [Cryobacterium sp. BB736]
MGEWVHVKDAAGVSVPVKTSDALLEHIHELTQRRDTTLALLDAFAEANPSWGEVMGYIELHLRGSDA